MTPDIYSQPAFGEAEVHAFTSINVCVMLLLFFVWTLKHSQSHTHSDGMGFGNVMPPHMPPTIVIPPSEQLMPPADHVDDEASCSRAVCRWRDEASGDQCGIPFNCGGVSEHFKDHDIRGIHESEDVLCRWEGCFVFGLRKNFVRHVRERHLRHPRGKRCPA